MAGFTSDLPFVRQKPWDREETKEIHHPYWPLLPTHSEVRFLTRILRQASFALSRFLGDVAAFKSFIARVTLIELVPAVGSRV